MVKKELPSRKPNRLKCFDYSTNGAYFVTICAKNHKCILSDIVGDDAHIVPQMKLTNYGAVVEKYIKTIPGIEKYVIMPNHIHMIITINGTMWASSPTVSSLIKSFKILVTKEIGKAIFQRSFYDHIIRNESDYNEVWQYIDRNPQKWKEDKFYSIN